MIDAAKAIAGADGLRCAAIPTTLSGAEMTPFHRMPEGVDDYQLTRPAAGPRRTGPDGLPADAGPRGERHERARARRRGALHAALEPGRADGGAACGRADRRRASPRRSSTVRRWRWARCSPGYASGLAGFAVHHAVCQTIVRICGTPHAQTNAIMLPHFVRIMELRAREQIEQLGVALGGGRPPRSRGRGGRAARPARGGRPALVLRRGRRRAPEVVEAVAAVPSCRTLRTRPARASCWAC